MRDNGPILINALGGSGLVETLAVGVSETKYSKPYSLIDKDQFAVVYQGKCTGLPNAQIKLQQSVDKINWFTPDTFADIKTSLIDENVHGQKLAPIPVEFMRFEVIEKSGVTADTVVTIKVATQKRYTV